MLAGRGLLVLAAALCAAAADPQLQMDAKGPTAPQASPAWHSAQARVDEHLPMHRYDGHVLLRVVPRSELQVAALRTLFKDAEVDVWLPPSRVGEEVHFQVAPDAFRWTADFLKGEGLPFDVIVSDVQRLIDNQTIPTRTATGFDWDSFYRLGAMYEWMESTAKNFPEVASVVKGGYSTEGRTILGVRIAHAEDLPVVYVEGGIHGREWLSPAAATYILDQLLKSEDPDVMRAARSFEWHVFPSVNPDAYEYSHTTDRLWRKSRKRSSFRCYGVDLNRNFPLQWGTTGVSWDHCSETFPGTRAASEVETQTRIKYMEPLLPRMKAFIALHSYGQLLVFPWGHTADRASNYDALSKVATKTAESFAKRYGTQLRYGGLSEVLYSASGSSMDWALGQGVPYSYTLEMRPGFHAPFIGFLLPADQIRPATEETMDGVVALVSSILDQKTAV